MKREERKEAICKCHKGIVCLGLGLVTWLGVFEASVLQIRAAEPVAVSELTVQTGSGGVSAECVFTGYDSGSGYTMQLYLEKVTEDGTTSPVIYKDLAPTADGSGSGQTPPQEVESGIYRAVLMMSTTDSSGRPIVQFENSPLYDVVRNGDDYQITPHPNAGDGSGTGNEGEGSDSRRGKNLQAGKKAEEEEKANLCNHKCGRNYCIYQEATPDKDSLLAGECEGCGEIISYEEVPNSAYAAFLIEAAKQIRDAELSGEVSIQTKRWISFDRRVFEALADRPDVSINLEYRYEGLDYVLQIPAGIDTESLPDENGFCGFRYLHKLFGESEI